MRRRTSLLAVALAMAGAGAGTGAAVATLRTGPPAPPQVITPSLATTTVQRGNLSDSRLVPATLGFGTAREVRSTGTGVLTRLPRPGAAVHRGAELFRVNDQPVVVLYGDTPVFRPIDRVGMTGNDVLQLRRNLRALGYPSRAGKADTVDQPMLDEVRKWQQRLGVTPPGALRPGQVVVVPGPARVSEVLADLGAPAGDVVLRTTAKSKVVTIPMSAGDARTVKLGAEVAVVLPDGREIPGKVSAISRSIVSGADSPDSAEPPKRTVTVKLSAGKRLAALDAAPVQVRFTTAARKNVLMVPVTTLVALREGGYALQRPGGGLLAARTGVFAGGMVEVSGPGITAGLTVVDAR
ncbi:HlyD family secretion protein [Couchioplanes caeruleus]|uniref:HlyD family secretion protein n=1 Tax=Couchioplanes caeruleus TaxID=56438 RepID=UPI0020BFB1C2|nr:HlyD family secretion protein [Couchioplanes caeruleus]UQU63655.1 HlyD family secretion protein [Couchioplanes caeruleus]